MIRLDRVGKTFPGLPRPSVDRVTLDVPGGVTCVLMPAGDDTCADDSMIASGRKVRIRDDCSTGHDEMEVVGLVPDGVESVDLVMSDGSVVGRAVASGVWLYESEIPGPDDAYPAAMTWVGSETVEHPFPYSREQMGCMPTE